MSWGDVAFDADLVANVLGNLKRHAAVILPDAEVRSLIETLTDSLEARR
jgi:hypothetical protein